MFSVVGTIADDVDGRFSSAIARIAQMTAAPPAMSSFIRSMPSAGLIEMPPVSNVMPLPTSPSTGVAGAPGGLWRITITRGGSALPRATPSSRPIPSCAISCSSRTSTREPGRPADLRGALGEDRRRQHVRRLVGELAREVAGLAEDPSALDARLERRPIVLGAAGQDQDLVERRRAPLAALVAIAAEGREHQPFRSGLDRLGQRDVSPVEPREALHAALSRLQGRGGGDAPQPLRREIGSLARADERNPAGPPPVGDRRDEDLVRPALRPRATRGPASTRCPSHRRARGDPRRDRRLRKSGRR